MELLTVFVNDLRHYARQKPKDNESAPTKLFLKLNQPSTLLGEVDVDKIAGVVKKISSQGPDLTICSPQPRAWKMAYMVLKQFADHGWMEGNFLTDKAFDDSSSDPEVKPWLEDLKKFCKAKKISVEKAFLVWEKARNYMFTRTPKMFASLTEHIIKLNKQNAEIMIASHGGEVEMRALRIFLHTEGIVPFTDQTSTDMEKYSDKLPGGMSQECEGFRYKITVDTENKEIVAMEFVTDIRLPKKDDDN